MGAGVSVFVLHPGDVLVLDVPVAVPPYRVERTAARFTLVVVAADFVGWVELP